MRYVEAPDSVHRLPTDGLTVFLAGGITGCPDWQDEIVEMFGGDDDEQNELVLLNPRQADFPIHNPLAAKNQVSWEYSAINAADVVLFWFPMETICPIVLFELGAQSRMQKRIVVGTHPEYPRRQDVVLQLGLTRPDTIVHTNLESLVEEVNRHV